MFRANRQGARESTDAVGCTVTLIWRMVKELCASGDAERQWVAVVDYLVAEKACCKNNWPPGVGGCGSTTGRRRVGRAGPGAEASGVCEWLPQSAEAA